uniref:Late embryogenesis abundant protein LEA-2 subgroup domain-containing protein n=1 Tax=Kalanchoe fedtschenkoi TaxID=63787 RepID=A0A7N0V5D6_KALFE
MGDSKQGNLNGAYYGPSVLPQRDTYHRRRSSGGGCCCNPFTCLCKCVFNLIFKLILTAIVILGLVVLVLWLIFRPNPVKFHITDASLTQFDLANSTLKYNLALNASVRNPNSRIGIYYDVLQIDAFYEDQRFSTVNLTPFYQGHKNTSDLQMVFKGQQVIVVDSAQYATDKSAGVFEVDLRMRLRVRFRLIQLLKIRVGKFRGKVDCDLKVPVSGSGVAFAAKRCDIDYV